MCPLSHPKSELAGSENLLLPLAESRDEYSANRHLQYLIECHADPIIKSVIRSYMTGGTGLSNSQGSGSMDAEDIRSEIVLILLERLHGLKRLAAVNSQPISIRNFHSYVKVTAKHTLWRLQKGALRRRALSASQIDNGEDFLAQLADRYADVEKEVHNRHLIKLLWQKIMELSLRQRIALLLNCRDSHGRESLSLLLVTGIVSIEQLALALDTSTMEFLELLHLLPLDDAAIGRRLGESQRDIINLRLTARRRLTRALRRAENEERAYL